MLLRVEVPLGVALEERGDAVADGLANGLVVGLREAVALATVEAVVAALPQDGCVADRVHERGLHDIDALGEQHAHRFGLAVAELDAADDVGVEDLPVVRADGNGDVRVGVGRELDAVERAWHCGVSQTGVSELLAAHADSECPCVAFRRRWAGGQALCCSAR